MLYDAHLRNQTRMPRYVEKIVHSMQSDVGKTRSHVHGTMASVPRWIVHIHDDDGIPQHRRRHEMSNGHPHGSRTRPHDFHVLQMRR